MNTIQMTTHLNFRGRAHEALDFYASVFGGERTVVTYGAVGAATNAAQASQVMWGQVAAPSGFRIMAYDVQPEKPFDPGVNAVYVSLRGTDADEITGYWQRLVDGAEILQPLGPSAWSPLYGMVRDRFGVVWIVDVAPAPAS